MSEDNSSGHLQVVDHASLESDVVNAIYAVTVVDSNSGTRNRCANCHITIVDLWRRFRSFSPGLTVVHSPK